MQSLLNSAVLSVVGLASVGSVVHAAAIPIAVTGYNYDVVVEAAAPFQAGANGKFTNEGESLYERLPGRGSATSGLPNGGTLVSPVLVGGAPTTFQLAPYTANNALIVAEGSGPPKFKEWNLVTPAEYSSISVLGLSAGGQSNFSMVVYFTDNTNTGNGDPNFEGSGRFARGAFDGNVIPDWFQSGGTSAGQAQTGVGRVNEGGGVSGDDLGGGVRLQQFNFNLAPYAGKLINKIEFESTGGDSKNRTFLALSGELVGAQVPEPTSLGLLAAGGLMALRRRRAAM